jgi:hypothetical protein
MLCFILDRPYRGRYFHDCNTRRAIRFAVKNSFGSPYFYRSSAVDAFPARFTHAAPNSGEIVSKLGPDSPNAVSQKF